jgi:hypothetical protein
MVVDELSTGCLYDAPAARGGVVGLAFAEGDTLSHLGDCESGGFLWSAKISFCFPRAIPPYTTTHPSTKDPSISISCSLDLFHATGQREQLT